MKTYIFLLRGGSDCNPFLQDPCATPYPQSKATVFGDLSVNGRCGFKATVSVNSLSWHNSHIIVSAACLTTPMAFLYYNWIAHQKRPHKNQFSARPWDLQRIRNYVRKALVEASPNLCLPKLHCYFLGYNWTITFQKMIMELGSPHTWMRLVEYFSSDVLGASGVCVCV